ncbi:MAG: Maf family protein [Lachnospiraceae bacterium]|nr:Maf family protein [Lachnospiraceae bacterium]
MLRYILASQSPRRKELMAQAGFTFDIRVATGEEVISGTDPVQTVLELSAQKAEEVLAKICETESKDQETVFVVIGADTVVACDGKILGKPEGADEAVEMIHLLQGRTHRVYTGVTVCAYDGLRGTTDTVSFYEGTEVEVFPMTEEEIEAYVSSEETYDKAGGYGIQGSFGVYIKGIHGDYNNVVGLPLARLYQELKQRDLLCENK